VSETWVPQPYQALQVELAAGSAITYSIPAGNRFVLRGIIGHLDGAPPAEVIIQSNGHTLRNFPVVAPNVQASFDEQCYVVFNPFGTITVALSAAGTGAHVILSGDMIPHL